MNREKILEMSRKEQDEGMLFAEGRGKRWGFWALLMIYLIVIGYNFWQGISNLVPASLFLAYVAAENASKYQFTREKKYLFGTLLLGAGSVLFVAVHILQTLPR